MGVVDKGGTAVLNIATTHFAGGGSAHCDSLLSPFGIIVPPVQTFTGTQDNVAYRVERPTKEIFLAGPFGDVPTFTNSFAGSFLTISPEGEPVPGLMNVCPGREGADVSHLAVIENGPQS